jgi:hypothetical protein
MVELSVARAGDTGNRACVRLPLPLLRWTILTGVMIAGRQTTANLIDCEKVDQG